MESKGSPKVNIGSASIVVVFCVLCLTVFAVLSLITANSEKKLADKAAQSVSDYYAADLVCSEKASAIAEAAKEGKVTDKAKELRAVVTEKDTGTIISYSEKINETQELSVILHVKNGEMSIEKWQACDNGTWEADDTLIVWDGQ